MSGVRLKLVFSPDTSPNFIIRHIMILSTRLFIPDASSHLNLASVAFPRRSPTSCFGGSSSSARFFIGVKMASRLYIANITFQHFECHMYSNFSFYILHFYKFSFISRWLAGLEWMTELRRWWISHRWGEDKYKYEKLFLQIQIGQGDKLNIELAERVGVSHLAVSYPQVCIITPIHRYVS